MPLGFVTSGYTILEPLSTREYENKGRSKRMARMRFDRVIRGCEAVSLLLAMNSGVARGQGATVRTAAHSLAARSSTARPEALAAEEQTGLVDVRQSDLLQKQ